jgi:hypothetical protein
MQQWSLIPNSLLLIYLSLQSTLNITKVITAYNKNKVIDILSGHKALNFFTHHSSDKKKERKHL